MFRLPSRRCTLWTALACLFVPHLFPGAAALPTDRYPFSIVTADYRDGDGDHDRFPDTGESGRVVLTIRNGARSLTGVSFVLVSDDADVACIGAYRVAAGDLTPGQEVTVGSLDPSLPGFTFRASDALNSLSGADPARVDLCLRMQAAELDSLSAPVCFSLPADLDLPAGVPPDFVAGPDGVAGTADDGTVLESFDADRDGDGNVTVNDTFRTNDAGTGTVEHGSYLRGTGGTGGTGVVAGVACGGFTSPEEGNSACALDPEFPMDWHLHCPPGAGDCPNAETGPCRPSYQGFCSYATPADGQKALSPPNSLHMGAHFDPLNSLGGDTTHLRALQAFVSAPMNLTSLPRPGDLHLSMFHIADLIDDNAVYAGPGAGCLDCGDVQIQSDRNPDPAVDDWGPWDKLAPFQNVYDHVSQSWSAFGPYYCKFTPADAGTAPPAPRGAHETMCFPQGAWSHCGTVRGTVAASAGDCAGPGVVDLSGRGVWVETRFDLAPYLGQRIRVRWIGSSWMIDAFMNSYLDFPCDPGPCIPEPNDDGWWLDDVRVAGLVTAQRSPDVDRRPSPPFFCPAVCADLDGDGYGSPGSALCPAGPLPDCDDETRRVHPGAAEVCDGIDDDCDGLLPVSEADADVDGFMPCTGDCDDSNGRTYPGAGEFNDGADNQCPGDEGHGISDEMEGEIFFSGYILTWETICWDAQDGATSYLLARSSRPDLLGDCSVFPSSFNCLQSDVQPDAGTAFYYLVRAESPHVGSWGRDSLGSERTGICGLAP